MKQVSIVGIIFVLVLVVLLKVFEDSIPKISDPLTNILVLVLFGIFAVVYGVSQMRKRS
ncbi:hypothetical protein [Lysinibacillus contaminans]|uniref:hypothetical protein n=1 Tax=Lysinibacillus contaminans TaxID=1293441 RepID=UPI000A60B36B|nr:hypothetical protein [Lysinibacillus contaminans]